MFYNLMTVVYEKFTNGVVYSALSEAYQTSHEKFKSTYYKLRLYSDAAILFVAGGFFSAGHLIIDVIYDDRYTSAGPILQMLAIGLVALRYKMSDQCFTVINKPFMMTVSTAVRALFLMIALPLAYKYWGLNAAIWAIVLTNFASIPFVLYFKNKTDLLDIKKELIVLPLFFVGAAMGYVVVELFRIAQAFFN
jgi:O-antigen/teichoic acid export membrane protein